MKKTTKKKSAEIEIDKCEHLQYHLNRRIDIARMIRTAPGDVTRALIDTLRVWVESGDDKSDLAFKARDLLKGVKS